MSDQNQNVETVEVEAVDSNRLEALIEDLSKSLKTDDASVEIISKGADAIVAQNKELVSSVEKSIASIVEKVDALALKLEALEGLNEKVEKGFNDLASQPLPAKSVQAEAEVAPMEVQETKEVITKGMVIEKAIAELGTANPSRVAELRKGIAQLESNYDPAQVAVSLNLK